MYPQAIQRLIEAFSRFPAIGPRAAGRFVFYLLRASDEETEELVQAIRDLKQRVRRCSFCFHVYQSESQDRENGLCKICADQTRNSFLLCVVEKESDLEALEKTKQYQGRYFIMGGVQDILKKDGIQNMQIGELQKRIEGGIEEVIIALNLTAEGESAALYIERMVKPLGVKTTRIGRGIPMGGELEYADEETLRSALEGRR